ncbi:hypothetical protein [Psychroserpens algicola]|uniref:Peptidase S74 domain-containing protein n=1 Tax=Psychroserpens algicola TaxID=1719034 RepID=A0ABT0H5E5_9FLAO|nr:hypothetical protein [Psychroserpens algicola]MCK8479615.1 hypothetical protein [Psychroserpens algicola]
MKKHVSFTLIMLIGMLMGFAQTDGISYQAVIIDNNPQEIPGVDVTSNSLPNTPLKVRFSIIDNTSQIEYQETQDTETDAFGMINLMIGQGELTSETLTTFNQVYWDNEKFLRVEIDLFDGNGFVEFSYQNLTYIPYIRHREIIATSTLDVDGATNLNNNLSVNNGSPTHLTGSLTTDGATDLNANLTVNNQSPTYLTGDLTVDGLVSFDGELAVGGDTQLYSDLTVEGNSMLNGSLDVVGQATFNSSIFEDIIVNQSSILNTITASGATQINNTLTVSQNSNLNSATINQVGADPNLNSLIVNGRSLLSGRVLINPQLTTNSQNNANSYPLEIRGRHGIWISTNNGTPSSNNNFLTFSNSSNSPVGAIEGQTLNELNNSFRFIWDASAALLEEAFIVAEGVACGAQLDLGEAGVMAVQGFAAYAHLLELTINATNNVGVSFKTGGADYAEFLEKENHTMQFESGEIVGVFGGKISKTTKGAQHIMVISTNPIVLGNMPESLSTENFEKVAFLGQVPVRVVGRVGIGDYILPSGNNDGLAIAKTPEKMTLSDYSEIIGVAWQASLGDVFGYINVAIGLNTNDLAFQLQQQQNEIEAVKKELKAIHTLLKGDNDNIQNEATINNVETSNQLNSRISLFRSDRNDIKMSEAEFEEWLNKYGYIFENRMTLLGNYLKENNVNISEYPEIEKLITNTKQALRDMNNGKYMKTLWESFQKRYPKAFTTK